MLAFPRKSKTLQMLLSLKQRCTLSEDDEAALYTEQLGYQGERAFALRLEKSLRKEYVVLYDVLLEQKNSHFQMDCLMICEEQIYLIELKYLEGNYYFHDNDFYTVNSRKRIKNPFYQIQRSEDLLRSFLHKHKLPYNIHSYVVFNHPSFTLYQAPIQTNMILPTQIEKFLQKLNNQPVRTTSKEELLVETFYREHIEKNPFERLPAYPYEKLNKGIFCLNCQEQLNREGRYHVRCTKCSYREWIDSAILRNIVEFNILFPKEKMNKSKMGEWCGDIASPKTIRRVLNKYLIRKGEGKGTYYEFY